MLNGDGWFCFEIFGAVDDAVDVIATVAVLLLAEEALLLEEATWY